MCVVYVETMIKYMILDVANDHMDVHGLVYDWRFIIKSERH